MAGLVIVSHSHRLAEGVVELVRQVAGPTVPVAAAGGLDAEQIGTSPERILEAIRQVGEGDVLVLMDLGSALLSAEMALEFLAPEERQRIRLVAAPLVEGAVAAAAVLAAGGDVEGAVREAREALRPKLDHLGEAPAGATTVEPGGAEVVRVEVVLPNPAGLHARPAGQLVREAARFDARIWARNKRQPQRRASLASLNELALLDARQHDTLILEASGPQGREALEALAALVRAGFGEIDPPASPTPGGDQEAGLGPGGAAVAGAGPAPAEAPAPPAPGTVLEGVAVTPGVAWGRTVQRRRAQAWTPQGPDRPPEEEWARLEAALHQVAAELAALQAGADAAEAAAIFEAQALFLQDPMLLEPARRAVEAGQPAAVAWLEACRATAAAYRELANPLLRQRAADVEDVGQRVFRRLTEQAADPAGERLEPGTILVVDELWPSDVAWLRDQPVAAVCAAQGDRTSHAAILARSLAVPVIVGLGAAILQLPEGTPGAVDGLRGRFYVAPDDGTLQALAQRAAHWQALERRARNEAGQPAALRGGRRVVVAANVGTPEEAREAARLGAEGVGLFRTEVLFVGRPQLPDTAAQEALYRQVAQAVAPHPVVLRTLDVGGDKPLPQLAPAQEANPFLGVRGLRLTLQAPHVLEGQVRAALRVAADHPLRLLLPMVSTLDELLTVRRLVEGWREELQAEGVAVPPVALGIMVEVPSAALVAERLAPHADFFSLGTNDLTQYTLAADRGNPGVRHLADGLHPAVLRLIGQVVEAARVHRRPVAVCGELASDPEAIPILVGLGVDELSMVPQAIPTAKALIRQLEEAATRDLAREALALATAAEVRALARQFLDGLATKDGEGPGRPPGGD